MNSLKTFMNKVGERVREVAPQTSLNIVDGTDPNNETVEGFLCPTCYLRLHTPEELERHYSEQHLDPSANYLCPVCKARLNSQPELELHYTANHSEKDFNNQSLDVLREELIELSTSLREERWYSEELKKEVERFQEAFKKKEDSEDAPTYVHKSQLDAVEEAKNSLSKEVVLLRKQLSESIEQNGALRGQRDLLEQRASEFAVERAELRATLDCLQTEKVGLESELHDLNNTSTSQQTNDKQEIENLSKENTRLEAIINSKLIENQSQKERELALQQDLKLKSENVASVKEEMRNLKVEVDLLKKKFQDKSDEVEILTTKVRESEKLLEERTKFYTCEEDLNLTNSEISNNGQPDEENAKIIEEKEEEIHKLTARLTQAQRDIKNAEDLVKEKFKLIDNANEKVSRTTNLFNEVNTRVVELEMIIKERDKMVDDLSKRVEEIDVLKVIIKEKEERIVGAVEEHHNCLRKLKDAEERLLSLEDSLTKANEAAEVNRLSSEATKDELCNLSKILESKSSLIDELNKKIEDNNKDCESLTKQINEANGNKERLEDSLLSLEEEISSLKNQLKESHNKSAKLEEQLKTAMQESTNQVNRISFLEESNSQHEKAFQQQSDDMATQIAALEQKCNSMKEQHDHLNAALASEAAAKINAETEVSKLVQQVEALHLTIKEKESVVAKSSDQLKKIEKDQETLRKEYTTLCESLQSTKEKLKQSEEEMQSHYTKVTDLETQIATQEAEIAGLAGDKLELEVKVESAADEQSSLVERCFNAEAEVERLQVQLTQLRRKLDDSTAALHELGRENQSLQMETCKLAGRKWADDSEVPNCTQCSKTFTITIRKHHCRNCGQIFCGECSTKQAPLEANKRPVRVCDSCHAELLTKA